MEPRRAGIAPALFDFDHYFALLIRTKSAVLGPANDSLAGLDPREVGAPCCEAA
jgi:hypothetical protein